jgi:hypothetical protein
MTTASSRPLVHYYDPGKDPMEMVETASGRMERWRADALLVGETSALADISKQIRDDAIARMDAIEAREAQLNARDDAISAREKAHAVNVTNFTDFVGRAATLLDRLAQTKSRADAEAQAEPLATPPCSPGPGDDTHIPSGELHDISPKDPEQQALATADELPAGGELHLNTPIPIPAATESAHTDQAEFPDPELPKPPVTAQPISPGLDEEA